MGRLLSTTCGHETKFETLMTHDACQILEEIVRLVATRLIARADLLEISTEQELGGRVSVIMEGQHANDHGQLVGVGGRTFKALRDLVEHAAARMGGEAELVLRDPVNRNGKHDGTLRIQPWDKEARGDISLAAQNLIERVAGIDAEMIMRDDNNGRVEINAFAEGEISPKLATALTTLVKAIGKARWNKSITLNVSES